MENLKELAKKNAEKGSYVRKAVKDFMDMWAEVTKGCEHIYSGTMAYEKDHGCLTETFYLRTGTTEIKACVDGMSWTDVHESRHFSNHLSIRDLRAFSEKLPAMIAEIEQYLLRSNKANDSVTSSLRGMIESAK